MAPTQLFLSCVSGEFGDYRDKLRHNLDLVHVSVKTQEDFIAGGVPTLDKLDTYIKSCDVVIHLVGDGLGSIAKPRSLEYLRRTYPSLSERFPVLAPFLFYESEGLSYTQWEAWLALLHDKKLLICVPGAEAPRKQGFQVLVTEQGLQQAHLDRLRGVESYPEVKFLNIDNLSYEILRALSKDLLLSASQISQSRNEWSWPKPWDFTLFSNEKREGFVGREWLFAEVRNWATNPDTEQALLIVADYGVGKTAFLAEFVARNSGGCSQASEERSIVIAAHHFCTLEQADTLIPGVFVKCLASQLAQNIPAYRQVLETNDANELRRFLDEANIDPMRAFEQSILIPLSHLHQTKDIFLIVVDGLDEAKDPRAQVDITTSLTIVQLLSRFAKHLPPWLKLLATSRRRLDVLKTLSQSFSLRKLDAEEPRNLADLCAYATERCERSPLRERLNGAGLSPREVAKFLSSDMQSSGKFLYVALVLNEIASGLLPLICWDDLNSLPCGLEEFYKDSFQRRFPTEESYAPVAPILAIISEAREPMSRSDLAAILKDDQVLPTKKNISEILKPMHDLLRLRLVSRNQHEDTGGEVYFSFDHLSLKQWLTTEDEWGYLRAERFTIDCHEAFDKIRRWSLSEIKAGRAHSCQYLVRQLYYHLTKEERSDVISEVLSQFPWLAARLRLAGLTSLMSDFLFVTLNPAIRNLKRALYQSAHVLRHDQNPAVGSIERAIRQYKQEISGDHYWDGQELQLASQLLARLSDDGELMHLRHQAGEWLLSVGGAPPLVPSLLGHTALQLTLNVESTVNFLVELPSGQIASGSVDGIIRLWDPDSGDISKVFRGHLGSVNAMSVLNDGSLASGSSDGTIRIWDVSSGAAKILDAHEGRVTSMTTVSNNRLATGHDNGSIILWDLLSYLPLKKLGAHRGSVGGLQLWCDSRLVSSSKDGRVIVWDLVSRDHHCLIDGHGLEVSNLSVLSDGRLICSFIDNTIHIWQPDGGPASHVFSLYGIGSLFSLIGLCDGRIATGTSEGKIHLWDPITHSRSGLLQGHVKGVMSLELMSDGRIVSGSGDGTVRIWDLSSDAGLTNTPKHDGWVNTLSILADGRLVSGSSDGTIYLWDPVQCEISSVLQKKQECIWSLAQLPDSRLAFGCRHVSLFHLNDPNMIEELVGHHDDILSLTVLNDGRLASGSRDGSVRLWETIEATSSRNPIKPPIWERILMRLADKTGATKANSFNCCQVLNGHQDGIWALALLGDSHLVTGSEDSTIRIWDLTSDNSRVLQGHSAGVRSIVVVNDKCIVSASNDRTIRYWNLDTDSCTVLEGHLAGVRSLAFLPDGRLISASADQSVLIWDLSKPDGAPKMIFRADAPLISLFWISSLHLLVTGDKSGRLHWLKIGVRSG